MYFLNLSESELVLTFRIWSPFFETPGNFGPVKPFLVVYLKTEKFMPLKILV